MELKVFDTDRGPVVRVLKDEEAEGLLVEVTTHEIPVRALVEEIEIPDLDPTEIEAVRLGDKAVKDALVSPNDNYAGHYRMHSLGKVVISSEWGFARFAGIDRFQEVAGFVPEERRVRR